jgi:tetratricopeptide (TPR) repeat protein
LYGNFALQNPSQREIVAKRGIEVLHRAAKVKISEVQLRLRLADAFNALNEDGEAARIYQEVLKESPDSPFLREGVRAQLANIYLRGSDHTKAAEQLQNLIQDNPTDAKAYYFLGTLAYNETNYTQAIESFSKVLLLNPEFEQAYYDLASAQISADKPADALVTLEKTRQKFPQKFFPEYLTGLAYSHQKDYTNALIHFTAAEIIAQATDPKQLKDTFFFQIGATFERKGDYEQAEKYFEKCLELSPNLSEAQNYLGYMLADRGVKLDRARDLIDRALKAEPKNSAYLDSMGWVLFKLNQPKEALAYLLDAVKNSEEEDAELYNHLGEIYSALHQADKAREAWVKSISLEPSESIRRKLEQLAR